MLLLLYPKLSSLINDRSIIFSLSHHVHFGNNYKEPLNSMTSWTCAYVITSCIKNRSSTWILI